MGSRRKRLDGHGTSTTASQEPPVTIASAPLVPFTAPSPMIVAARP
ncbi:hypothetical protein K530_46490 [Streptomyces noursei CCRC 11814]|nr:hypothetical protein K530_46490 [Streptomyces noursei CCRC 11814]